LPLSLREIVKITAIDTPTGKAAYGCRPPP
jgi:hypothetical protein